jgi:hypothetical protein
MQEIPMSNRTQAPPKPQPDPVKSNGQPPAADSTSTPPQANPVDLFADLAGLRLSQDFVESCGVERAVLTIPVKKPAKHWFLRVHPTMQIETAVLDLKEEGEVYFVEPSLWRNLAAEPMFVPRALFVAMNRQDVLFVWPIRLPGVDGKLDDWSRSALAAADLAKTHWVRVVSNMNLGAYDVHKAKADWPEPKWPELSFSDILRIAFTDRIIDSLDHPALKKLRGEE